MNFVLKHRVPFVFLCLAIALTVLIVWRLKDPQARTVPRRSAETLVGVITPVQKDFGFDVGSESNAPQARAVIGGLAVSTFLTLFLIPTLYTILETRFPRRRAEGDAN